MSHHGWQIAKQGTGRIKAGTQRSAVNSGLGGAISHPSYRGAEVPVKAPPPEVFPQCLLRTSMVCATVINKRSHDHEPVNMNGSGFPMAAGLMAKDVGGVVKEPRPSPRQAGHVPDVSPVPGFWAARPQAIRPSTASPRKMMTENLDEDTYHSSMTIQTLGGRFVPATPPGSDSPLGSLVGASILSILLHQEIL